MTDAAARDTTRELVQAAVQRQLVSDVPLGCFLSGGRDSSVIAAAMRAAAPPGQKVLTFSMGFDDPRYDETPFAQRVAAHLGTTHRSFTCKPDAAADLPKLAEVFGEPFADSSALPTHYLSQQTRHEVKVALSGDGGDELFGGYDRYRAMWLSQKCPWLAYLAGPLRWLPSGHPKSRLTRLKRWAATAHLPPGQRYASYLRLFDFPLLRQLLHPDLLESAPSGDNLADLYTAALPGRDPVTAALAVDRATYLPEDLFTKVDRASMLHALEVRSPFMDPDLLTFASSLTTAQLLSGGPKRLLREAFAADLPPEVFHRPKMGFALPMGSWFRNELRGLLHESLFASDSFASQHFQVRVVRDLVEAHARGVDHAQRLYALLMLELWYARRGYAREERVERRKESRPGNRGT
jgi:asparagine synthase (glutamine-hydrolysing)